MLQNTYSSPPFNLAHYYLNKQRANLSVFFDAKKSKMVKKSQIGILGCYHRLNVGDMALGVSIQKIAEEQNVSTKIESIHRNDCFKYAKTDSIIFGGGSITTPDNFEKLKKSMSLAKKKPKNVAIVGVDLNAQYFSDDILELLQEVNFISYRCFYGHKESQLNIQKILGRSDTIFHPDLVFGLYSSDLQQEAQLVENQNKPKILGINIYPWYLVLNRGKWIAKDLSSNYFGISSMSQPDYISLNSDYIKLLLEMIAYYQSLGYEVHHIPFAVEDDLFARTVFGNSSIFFHKYTSTPSSVLRKVSNCSLFVGTRLHANIFSLIQRVPLISIAYGMKCENLFGDIEIPRSNQITHDSFIENKGNHDFFLDIEPVVLSHEKLDQLSRRVKSAVTTAIRQLTEYN